MHLYHHWRGIKEKHNNIVVALGNFDGLHIGHQKLISDLVALAKKVGGTPAVFTFHPHPLTVLKPEKSPPLLLSQEAKQKFFAKLGVEVLLQIPFDLDFSGISPEDFIKTVLHEEVGACGVIIGYNYTFGRYGRGTPALLEELSAVYGFELRVIPPIQIEGQPVSSTLIRGLLASGEVTAAAKYLGYYPFVEGEVVTGEQRGRNILGFPTANLNIDQTLLVPANGVYLAKVHIDGESYFGVANIGVKPTFNTNSRNIEVHLLDFYKELYGIQIKVSFTKRLRKEKKFETPSELVKQIERDVLEARAESLKNKE
ncbi:MAG: bifunctional riboflavin kinase/FAD synthetase [Desulfotomaculaceae bacterium]|nr:bifunctional riboflavin kinase/FAD synthetase [Desulfotomaculaceae bacterium]